MDLHKSGIVQNELVTLTNEQRQELLDVIKETWRGLPAHEAQVLEGVASKDAQQNQAG